ncbi:cell morphogenesis N-terminal-domain-containing protein [Rhodocollybia butyracea]|uniref:Cell morphogenesis N-terminal-domain-containing protein n=1 Tax=Rhodocollybia butyracea TaxID=206335 RepID=A0A9P5PYH4_9AGAR|nr:cell morphogenesis N-terminal-domain-containing protein [Rhodocollybia butyracea]
MSEGIQITIPDFDDDEYSSSTIPFGRSAGNGFGFGSSGFGSAGGFGSGDFGGTGSAPESPTSVTPLASAADRGERSYFSSHNRGDSINSVDSAGSGSTRSPANYPSRPPTSFSSFNQPSGSTTNTGFNKKPSFASFRNAFKSGKSVEPPPVPQLDNYVFKNPFNRSTSSLNSSSVGVPSKVNTASPPYGRPPTPGSVDTRFVRGKKSHSQAKSFHSQSGSIFHTSDGGSEGHGLSSSPPPVPRVPYLRSETPDFEDDKVVMDPKTPSDYALHAVFIRFASSAETKIDTFLRQPLDQDPLLPEYMGPDVDSKFDETLLSLGQISQKHTKPVIDSIMRWRRSQLENVGSDVIRYHTSSSPTSTARVIRTHDVPGLLNERKNLAAIYIMCRALIAVVKTLSKDAIGENMGYTLEKLTFDQFKKPELKLLMQSTNHRTNAELSAALLGHLANIRFVSVTDRFLAELAPVSRGQVPKDLDMKYENLLNSIRHIQIKVWPSEAFEEGAEFMESLSKAFMQAHGFRLKSAFAETLIHILHPIAKTAQAETNIPIWGKAIELIYPKAREMAAKPRYWNVAFPLMITSLCVAPQDYFKKHWVACFEAVVPKLKEKSLRILILNGLVRLIWTYLYRCQESPSTTTTKLENLLKYLFPPNRTSVYPNEGHLEPFVYITHFVLSRHFEYGRDLCLELIQESVINSTYQTKSGSLAPVFASDRTSIAVQAILMSLHNIERESPTPSWPSTVDFFEPSCSADYPSSSEALPASIMSRSGMQDFFDRCGSVLAIIATTCGNGVGQMSMFDEQWSLARLNLSYEEMHNYVIRKHPEVGSLVYPASLVPQVNLLRTCFISWPRCLHPSLPVTDAIDLLLRGVIHVEPLVGEAARDALTRFLSDPAHSLSVVSQFTQYLFNPIRLTQEGSGTNMLFESRQLLDLWVISVESWIGRLTHHSTQELVQDEDVITPRCLEIEAGAMFLLSHELLSVRLAGVKVVRLLGKLMAHLSPEPSSPSDAAAPSSFVALLHGRGGHSPPLDGFDELLEKTELLRLEHWRQSKESQIELRIAESNNKLDLRLWHHIFPRFIQACMHIQAQNLLMFRHVFVAAASRYHTTMTQLAGLSSKLPAGRSLTGHDGPRLVEGNMRLIEQWHMWVQVLCATATSPEVSRPVLTQLAREHSRVPSDISFERERLTTSRGLFRYLTPYLDSEYTPFRDAAVLCISSFPADAYPQLLEDLSLLAGRQFYDDPRSKMGLALSTLPDQSTRQAHDETRSKASAIATERIRRQERLHSAVARIYYLTAHFLQYQRSAGRQAALANVLKFVRNTQTFLTSPEMRDNYTLQRLRRYFCGTVERLFEGLATLEGADRFIPTNMHLTLYRLCEEWCQFGPQSESVKQRFMLMKSVATASSATREGVTAVEKFQEETLMLSYAAVGALSTLCQKAFCPPGVSSGSPTVRHSPDYLKPLTSGSVLERLSAILSSSHLPTQERGKKALKSLLALNNADKSLLDEAMRRAVVMTDQSDTNNGRFFEVISHTIASSDSHGFTFAQAVCLALSNLCHPLSEPRREAFNLLEAIHHQASGMLSMSQFEATVSSLASGTYVHSHRLLSAFLASEHSDQAISVLAQLATWLPGFSADPTFNMVTVLLLQSLEFWIPHIELMTDDKNWLSLEGHSALYHLMTLTLHYGQSHPEQILILWTRLVEPPNQSNGHATVRFLLEQSHKVGSTVFIDSAANIVACICQSPSGRQIFEDLCSLIEPVRMLPTIDHKLTFPDAHDLELWSDLDALFVDGRPRLPLGAAQFAWLFLADVALPCYWELIEQLPSLLHALFTHIDNRISFIRLRARHMLFQLLRAWAPGYDELPERSNYYSRAMLKAELSDMEAEAEKMYWTEEETTSESEPKMQWLCSRVVQFLEPLCPSLREKWGTVALEWSTSCSIRSTAFRSLQIFRALLPCLKTQQLALIIGRLSNTVSASDDAVKLFTTELILTVNAIVSANNFDMSLLPQIFWCTCATLATTVEQEFAEALKLLESLLKIVDFNDPPIIEQLLAHRPLHWNGSPFLQPNLLRGLRSSTTSARTLKILESLTEYQDGRIIDSSDGRVRDLYTLSLPWCLHSMMVEKAGEKAVDDSLRRFAENIGELAKEEGRTSIHKIMTSFAKGHFRTKDDFLRQSVSSLREHYGVEHWTEIVTLLIGLVLNRERWLRIQATQILKVLFQQRETRNPVELLGSELLMPLLRLLETDLASQALDVLEEPMAMSGGLAAKHVLRMSMHSRTLPSSNYVDSVATVFGVPEESGWSVVKADEVRDACRSNLMEVFDTCSMPSRPSRIEFEPEEIEGLAEASHLEEDLGGLVQNLHDLTTFFQDDSKPLINTTLPNRRLEARVAAILAKSTAQETIMDVPSTPFVDVFRVAGMSSDEDSDQSSINSDDELDAFYFDSPSVYRSAPNGHFP